VLQVIAYYGDNFATDVLPLGPDGWLSCSYDGSLRAGPRADAAQPGARQERGPAPAGDRGPR
jgi:hypothetical protein